MDFMDCSVAEHLVDGGAVDTSHSGGVHCDEFDDVSGSVGEELEHGEEVHGKDEVGDEHEPSVDVVHDDHGADRKGERFEHLVERVVDRFVEVADVEEHLEAQSR